MEKKKITGKTFEPKQALQELGRQTAEKIRAAADSGRIRFIGQDVGGGWNGVDVSFRITISG